MTDIRPNHTGCGFGLSSCPTCSGTSGRARPAGAGGPAARRPPTRSARLWKERQDAGVRMKQVLRADGRELPVAKEPDQRPVPETLADERHVVVGDAVEPLATAGAVEVDAEGGRAGAERRPGTGEHGAEILVGRPRVADLELDRLPDEDGPGERDRAALLVESGEASDDEVAAAEGGLADVDREAREDAGTRHPLRVVGHALDRLAQDPDRRPAAD